MNVKSAELRRCNPVLLNPKMRKIHCAAGSIAKDAPCGCVNLEGTFVLLV